jgi:hypothetical protein
MVSFSEEPCSCVSIVQKLKNFTLYSFVFLFALVDVEPRVLHLLGSCSTTWATRPACFSLPFFGDRVLFYAQASWTTIPLFVPPKIARVADRHMTICLAIGWDIVLWTFGLDWPQIMILLISISWVARITCVSHQACDCPVLS